LGPKGPIPEVGWGREKAGEGRRRRPGTVAAAACCTAVVGLRRYDGHANELWGMQGKVGKRLVQCVAGSAMARRQPAVQAGAVAAMRGAAHLLK
jgi:hypothetical protein